MPTRGRRICACGCQAVVAAGTEWRHLSGKGPRALAASVLSQNKWISAKNTSKPVAKKLQKGAKRTRSQPSPKEALIRTPSHARQHPRIRADPYFAEPASGVTDDTPVLSSTRRSIRIANRVASIAQQRWPVLRNRDMGSDALGILPASDSESEMGSDMEGDDSESATDVDLEEDDEPFASAEEGEEGISLWDLLGDGFDRTAAQLGPFQYLPSSYYPSLIHADSNSFGESEIQLLRAYSLKIEEHLTDKVFNKLRYVFPSAGLESLKVANRHIQLLSGFQPVRYDCCPNSCICYTGPYEDLTKCPKCRTNRFRSDGRAEKYFEYLPVIPRIRAMAANSSLAQQMRYRAHEYKYDSAKVTDIFDGAHYRSLLETFVTVGDDQLPFWFFADPRDIALGLSTDGFAPFKRRKKTAWPLILFNYNLPPDVRFHKENIISVGVIPGPKKPWDADSFLWPLIQELLQLAMGITAFDALSKVLFILHAYLIIVFGDIPAVSMLMRMKGHNAILPCRMCMITGIRIPSSRASTHYVPLHRLSRAQSHEYDPADLPLRTHASFMRQAQEVQSATSTAAEKKLATKYGINGVPLLSCLGSLSFPLSFPYDFMHLIWENLIPNLILLWTGEFKDIDHSGENYVLEETVWSAIGATSAAAGATIPAAFGSRVPNIATQKYQLTAETRSIWTLYLAPTLLRRRFKSNVVYRHFVKLVKLLNYCLQFEMPAALIDEIDEGFQLWVQEYER